MVPSASLDPAVGTDEATTLTSQFRAFEVRAGDVLAERFRIVALLGIGGFGYVYRARDLSLDIDVALKLLRPELARRPEAFERFRQELLLARQVSSPNVVRIHDIAQHGERWFISMDFVDGASLDQRLERGGRLDVDSAIALTRGLLNGLVAAHERGVVHRDLKPANILIDAGGNALISDFGIARSLGASGMTQSGALVGTPEYLSPEQARGERVDGRSDLYAVGLMLYEMLVGEPPYSGGTPAETVMRRIVSPPPSLARARADLPRWLHAFSDRLLRTSPAQRFADARAALRALESRRVPRPPVRWRRVAGAVLATVLLAALVVTVTRLAPWRSVATAPAAAAPARIATLALQAPGGDDALRAVARALDEHLQTWLRDDARHGLVAPRRVLDALARQTPEPGDAALLRQLPDIARATGAGFIVHGRLQRDGANLRLRLDLWSPAGTRSVDVRGADAAGLFVQYVQATGTLLAGAGLQAGAAPMLPAATVSEFGRGLLQLDETHAAAAGRLLAPLAATTAADALVVANLLRAQQAAAEDLSAQATRAGIIARFGGDDSAAGRELYARALLDSERDDDALAALAAAVRAYPRDAALNLLYAQAQVDAGNGAGALATLRHYVGSDAQDARAWYLLGRTAIQQGEAETAVSDYLTHALVLNRLRGDRAAEAETSNALGVGYERLGQLEAAAAQYAQAAAIRDKLGDAAGLAKSLRNLAIVQAVQGDSAGADRTLERVRALLEKNNDRASLADLYNDRGVVAEEHGAYAEALGFYRKALALRQELNLPAQVADSLNNVGFASYALGDFDNALAFWQQALAQYNTVDDRNGALRIDESMGLLDIARGRFAAARARLEAALRNAEDHQLPEETAVAQTYLGQLALYEGRYAAAAAAAQRAMAIFARRDDQRGSAEATLLQANIALALGDAAAAQAQLDTLAAARLSPEQRAMRLLAEAARATLAGDEAAAAQKRGAAAAAADAHSSIGVRVRLADVAALLRRDDLTGAQRLLRALRAETVRLAEVPLRLRWLELETAAALRAGHDAEAVTDYRQALALLRTSGRWADAVVLHRLGAQALAAPAEAQAARDAADTLEAQIVADAPVAARASLQQLLARRWHDESGKADGH